MSDFSREAAWQLLNKYNKERGRLVSTRLVTPQDNDILEFLESVPSKSGYIKQLIRADIAARKKSAEE